MHLPSRRSGASYRLSASLLACLLLVSGGTSLFLVGPLAPLTVSAQGGTNQTVEYSADYAPWTTLHGNNGHSGATGFESAYPMPLPANTLAWSKPAPIYSDPVVGYGMVFGGSQDFGVKAVSLSTGQLVWHFIGDGLAYSTPTLDSQGRLFVELTDPTFSSSTLWAIDAYNGRSLWVYPESTYGGSPVFANNIILTLSLSGVIAIEPASGNLLWNFPLEQVSFGSQLAIAEGLVLVVDGNDLIALNLEDGSENWRSSLSSSVLPSLPQLSVGFGTAFLLTENGANLTAISIEDGSEKWKVGSPGGHFFANNFAIAPDLLYTYHNSPTNGPTLIGIDLDTGQIQWGALLMIQDERIPSPLVTPQFVLAMMDDGTVHVFEPSRSSNVTGVYSTSSNGLVVSFTRAQLVLSGDRLLVTTNDGLFAFGTPASPSSGSGNGSSGDDGDSSSDNFYDFINSDNGFWVVAFLAGLGLGAGLSRVKIMGLRQKVNRLQDWVAYQSEQRQTDPAESEYTDTDERQSPALTADRTEEELPPTRAVVVCGAGPLTGAEKRALKKAYIIAADSGANDLHKLNQPPDLLIGDMDSISPEALDWCRELGVPEERFPKDKDATDGQLAVETALNLGFEHIEMVGALGGRTDHSYANMGLLELMAKEGAFGQIIGPDIDIFPVTPESPMVQTTLPGRTVSLMPLSEKILDIHSRGLLYPLRGTTMMRAHTLGVSNETVDSTIEVSVGNGTLLVGINRPPE